MPKCRICDSKVDAKATVCPVCGCPNPCDYSHKTSDLTINITEVKDIVGFNYKKKLTASLLTMLDIIGLGRFYLGYRKTGIFFIVLNVLLIVSSIFIHMLIPSLSTLSIALIIVLAIFLFNIIHGLIILFTNSLDANGDVLE